jgi:acyl-CoA thioesterase YciA
VTIALDRVVFHEPVYVGDLVSFRTRTVHIGNTSVRVKVSVEAERYADDSKLTVTEAEVVYVNIDENRRPVPVPTAAR